MQKPAQASQYLSITLVALIAYLGVDAKASEFALDVTNQKINNDMGPARTVGAQLKFDEEGPLTTLLLRLEDKQWRMKGVDYQGSSASAAAYYDIRGPLLGVSQVQFGSSALFPRWTVVQGLLYKAGDQGQWLWGAELGQTQFSDDSRLTTTKVGPTYYWAGAHPGYATYRYAEGSKSGNSGHTLDAQISLTFKLKAGVNHTQGQGAYSVLLPNASPLAAQVKSQETELRVSYDFTPEWTLQLKRGQTVVDDALNGGNVLRSQNTSIALSKRW